MINQGSTVLSHRRLWSPSESWKNLTFDFRPKTSRKSLTDLNRSLPKSSRFVFSHFLKFNYRTCLSESIRWDASYTYLTAGATNNGDNSGEKLVSMGLPFRKSWGSKLEDHFFEHPVGDHDVPSWNPIKPLYLKVEWLSNQNILEYFLAYADLWNKYSPAPAGLDSQQSFLIMINISVFRGFS